jgi:hypothetical protein
MEGRHGSPRRKTWRQTARDSYPRETPCDRDGSRPETLACSARRTLSARGDNGRARQDARDDILRCVAMPADRRAGPVLINQDHGKRIKIMANASESMAAHRAILTVSPCRTERRRQQIAGKYGRGCVLGAGVAIVYRTRRPNGRPERSFELG